MIPTERIAQKILYLRREKVLLDRDLAALYGVETRTLNQAVKRNAARFPGDVVFALSREETEGISQTVTSSTGLKFSKQVRAFTEQGVAMLSSMLNSEHAVKVNIAIMRAFVRVREILAGNQELASKVTELEKKYDIQFKVVFDAIRNLMAPSPPVNRKQIGFRGEPRKSS